MPNTLAHLGIQSLTTKTVFRQPDVKWIGLGCLIPDLPWITQRLIHPLDIVDPIDLRVYVIIQSTLFFCLMLSAAISLQAKDSKRIFLLLGFNCFFHLLLDATQTKWANGIHLLAPFSWQLINFNFYWPEQLPSLLLTLTGLILFPIIAWLDRHREMIFILDKKRQSAGFLLFAIYLLLPLLLFNGPLQANTHFSMILRNQDRTGAYIEIDRKPYKARTHTIKAYSDEQLQLRGNLPEQNAIISVQGRFTDNDTILLTKYHIHSPMRDIYSGIGISLLVASWLVALLSKRIKITYLRNEN